MDKKQEKAKELRYKHAMLSELNLDTIQSKLEDINEFCSEIRYWYDNEEALINALDGDEEEAFEFRMLFLALAAECDSLNDIFYENYITEHFDDFFVGIMTGGNGSFRMIGYDSYEEDYFSLTQYETDLASNESAKRLKRLIKDELISTCGQCFGIAMSYLNIRYKYDYLRAAYDILLDKNTSYLEAVKEIEKAYIAADESDWYEYSDAVREYEKLISALPDRAWIE